MNFPEIDGYVDLEALLQELGRREVVNLLVEGGGTLMGSLFDQGLVDKAWAFIAPKIVGGRDALSPVEGTGSWADFESDELEMSAGEAGGG